MTRVNSWIVGGLFATFLFASLVIAGVGKEERLQQLLKSHADTVKNNYEAASAAYDTGTLSMSDLIIAANNWRTGELDLATTPSARIAVYEKHIKILQGIEDRVEAMRNQGARGGDAVSYYAIKAAREAAEIAMLREQIKNK